MSQTICTNPIEFSETDLAPERVNIVIQASEK